MLRSRARILVSVSLALPLSASAQSGGFVTTLGTDTVQVEQFTRSGNVITGTLVTRMPAVRRLRYTLTIGNDGALSRYEQSQVRGDGTPLDPDPRRASMTYVGDSVIREALQPDGARAVHRIAVPGGAYPVGTIPIGASFAVFELAVQGARRAPLGSATLNRLLPIAGQSEPMRTAVLYAAPDSVEVDYFGQGRFGFKFDGDGRLIRSDWRNTTYRVLVARVRALDAMAIAAGWTAQEQAGAGPGALSPRDSALTQIGEARLSVVYARPARRGRDIWGGVVPWNSVWRLGADLATQFRTSADVYIGETLVPAGEYTLWMLPSLDAPQLIVSRLVRVFGTQYRPDRDFARIPMQRTATSATVERLTIAWTPSALRVEWGDAAFTVGVRVK